MGRWRKFSKKSMPEMYEPVLCLGKKGSPFVGYRVRFSFVEDGHMFMNLNGTRNGKKAYMWQRIIYPDWDEYEKLTKYPVMEKYRNQKWSEDND